MSYPEPSADLVFTKSPYSTGHESCVELAFTPEGNVWLRDSKDTSRPAHFYTAYEWECFTKWIADQHQAR